MKPDATIASAANILYQAAQTHTVCAPVRTLIGTDDVEAAYAVQQLNIQRRIDAGARLIGRKIGLTSEAVQRQLGVDQPDFGALLDDMEVADNGSISMDKLMQPKVETEIAFIMGDNLEGASITPEEMIAAVAHIVVSIEIIGSRIANWDIGFTDTVADNASASHFVLGRQAVYLQKFDVVNCKMEMRKNGEIVSKGTGGASMGSPIKAAIWLAETLSKLGNPLRKQDVILTGALGPVTAVQAGDYVTSRIEGLGEVSVSFIQ